MLTKVGLELAIGSNEEDEIFDDRPSAKFQDDELERVAFAEKISSRVRSYYKPDSSIIFGLVGEWGSGKTQVLYYVEKLLLESEEDWQIAWFTPWAAGDSGSLLEEFVATLGETIDEPTRLKEFYTKIDPLVAIAAPVLEVAMGVPGALKGSYRVLKDRQERRESWKTSVDELSASFIQRGRKTLIIADDVDRLSRAELETFLKLLRGLGNIDGISYLVAYDEISLSRTLSGVFDSEIAPAAARRYLEKFVQYQFTMPAMTRYQVFSWLQEEYRHAFSHMPIALEQAEDQLISSVILWQKIIRTPRAVRRFGANLKLAASDFTDGQVSTIDLANIVVLRQCFPSISSRLPMYRYELTGQRTSGVFDALLDGVALIEESVGKALLQKLFPNESQSPRFSGPRARNFTFFDRYLAGLLPSDNDSETIVSASVARAANGDAEALDELLRGEKAIPDWEGKLIAEVTFRDDWGEPEALHLIKALVKYVTPQVTSQSFLHYSLLEILAFLFSVPFSNPDKVAAILRDSARPEVIPTLEQKAKDETQLEGLWGSLSGVVTDGFLRHVQQERAAELDNRALQMSRFLVTYGDVDDFQKLSEALQTKSANLTTMFSRLIEATAGTSSNNSSQRLDENTGAEFLKKLTTESVLLDSDNSTATADSKALDPRNDSWQTREAIAHQWLRRKIR